jgi:hypothetical protein
MPELDMGFQRRLTELNERTQGLSVEAIAREIKAEQDGLIRTEAGSPQGDYFQYLQRMMDDGSCWRDHSSYFSGSSRDETKSFISWSSS